MIKQCMICGCEFDAKRPTMDKACSDPDCRKALYAEGVYRWKEKHIDRNRELNRQYMARRRARGRAEKELQKSRKKTTATDYAERQKMKTLELVGRVQI